MSLNSNYFPRYVLCENRMELSQPFILCTQEPYIMGKVLLFKESQLDKWERFQKTYRDRYAQVEGYRIVITYGGILPEEGRYPDAFEIRTTLEGMALFYLEHRIEDKKGYYKKFRIEQQPH